MDRQLQAFASRYMFATDGQISEGLDREMDDLTLGFRKSRQAMQRRGSRAGGRRPSRASAGGDDDIENYMLNAIDVGEESPRQKQKAREPEDPDDKWRLDVPRDEMFDAPVIPAGNPRRPRGRPARAQATINQLDMGEEPAPAPARRGKGHARHGRRAQEEERVESDEEYYDDDYYEDEGEYYDEDEGEYYDDEEDYYEDEEPPRPARRGRRQQQAAPRGSRRGSRARAAPRRREEPTVDGAIEALDVGLEPAAERATINRASDIMRQAHAQQQREAPREAPRAAAPRHPAARRRRGRRLSGSPARASNAAPPAAGQRPAQQLERQAPPPAQQPPPPKSDVPWGFDNNVVETGSDGPPVDIWRSTTARNCHVVQFDYTQGVDSCAMCQSVAESFFRSETVCHCYKSKRGNEFHQKCDDMMGELKAKQADLQAEREENGWSDLYRSFGSCEFLNYCPGS